MDDRKASSSTVKTSQPQKLKEIEVKKTNVLGVFDRDEKGPNYNELKPEFKCCIDKLIYQLDLSEKPWDSSSSVFLKTNTVSFKFFVIH